VWVAIGAALLAIAGLALALLIRRRKQRRAEVEAAARELESLTRGMVTPDPTDAAAWRLLDDQAKQLTAKLFELRDKPGVSEEQTAVLTQMQEHSERLRIGIDEHRALLVIQPPLTSEQLAPSATIVRTRIEDLRELATKLVARPDPQPTATSG
jgi:hypothetical protein